MNTIVKTGLGVVLGVAISLTVVFFNGSQFMVQRVASPLNFDQTVETILSNARDNNWKVPKVYDFQATMVKEGQGNIGKMKVIELCNPEYAYGLLKSDENKYAGVMMPCAFAVYETAEGQTFVSKMNVNMMGSLFGGDIKTAMSKVAEDSEKILAFLD